LRNANVEEQQPIIKRREPVFMKSITLPDIYAAVTVALLLILTAWGNALAMFVVAAVGVVLGLLIFGRRFARRGAVAAVIACGVAVVIALIIGQR
jgi:asparagine N-glycosylation enzyme membrane subunit Stt3